MAKAKNKAAVKKAQKKVLKPAKKIKAAVKAKPAAKAKAKAKAAPKKAAVANKAGKKPLAKATKAVAKAKPAVKATAAKPAVKPATKAVARAGDPARVFTPLDNRILVEKTGAAQRTPGGLYIPDTVSSGDRPTQGRVVAVGRGHIDKKGRLQPLDVKVGDTVMFNAFTGSDVRIENSDFLCLREDEILAVVKD